MLIKHYHGNSLFITKYVTVVVVVAALTQIPMINSCDIKH